MNDLNTTIVTILAIFGGISTIGAGSSVLIRIFNPYKKLKSTVEDHTRFLENDNNRLNEIEKRFLETDKSDKVLCKSMLALLDHEITGNSVAKLKEVKLELQDYLINK